MKYYRFGTYVGLVLIAVMIIGRIVNNDSPKKVLSTVTVQYMIVLEDPGFVGEVVFVELPEHFRGGVPVCLGGNLIAFDVSRWYTLIDDGVTLHNRGANWPLENWSGRCYNLDRGWDFQLTIYE